MRQTRLLHTEPSPERQRQPLPLAPEAGHLAGPRSEAQGYRFFDRRLGIRRQPVVSVDLAGKSRIEAPKARRRPVPCEVRHLQPAVFAQAMAEDLGEHRTGEPACQLTTPDDQHGEDDQDGKCQDGIKHNRQGSTSLPPSSVARSGVLPGRT